ncbi:universal stress protein UspE [Neptunicella sp.]|uniref:universal stress protein UspE n=1 Tax=Neptunicella sp. TaxID=2125986 RepID=UPI003F693784
MLKYQTLLAVIDPSSEEQKSLKRAIHIANKTGASITALLTIYDFSYEMTTMLSVTERESMRQSVVDDRTEWLTSIVEQHHHSNNINIDLKVVWHNRPFESIIHEVIQHNYDLVIKGTHEHGVLKAVVFTPTDWHLMRKCPAPVLLVKEQEWPESGNILAAVSAGTEDKEHQSLNNKLAKCAKDFAETLNAKVHLVNAYPGTPVNIAIEIPEFDPQNYNQSVRDYHINSMNEFCQTHGFNSACSHVREGLPETAIPLVAKDINAELVIIGTVGRTGISAALIGNTAEHVIDSLDCDVLTIKPEGFKSPMEN